MWEDVPQSGFRKPREKKGDRKKRERGPLFYRCVYVSRPDDLFQQGDSGAKREPGNRLSSVNGTTSCQIVATIAAVAYSAA
jgi:hypothetical protein